jgi:hypothetical protein
MTDILLAASKTDGSAVPEVLIERIKLSGLNSLNSSHSRRVFENGLESSLSWCRVFAADVPDVRLPIVRAIEDTGRLP